MAIAVDVLRDCVENELLDNVLDDVFEEEVLVECVDKGEMENGDEKVEEE